MRFSTFLLLFLFIFSFGTAASAQNLIYDWSVEEYETCPTGLALTLFVPHWLSFRGSPDYFNTCSSIVSPVSNSLGWQHPNSGDGMIGAVTFLAGISNEREHFGVLLDEPLTVGEAYDVSFYVAAAFNPNVTGLGTNNLGMLLMMENYLASNSVGGNPASPLPNFAHLNMDTFIADTAHWTLISGSIVADSAYQYIAFGNFFDDDNTLVNSLDSNDPEPSSIAYYFFDDFCIAVAGGDCFSALSSSSIQPANSIEIYPNPISDHFTVRSNSEVKQIHLFAIDGTWIEEINISTGHQTTEFWAHVTCQRTGVYIIEIVTEEGIERKRIVIKP